MEDNRQDYQGVVIPQEAIERSNELKRQSKKTLAQLPVYRAAGNLLYVVAVIIKVSPKRLRKFFDLMLSDVAEVSKAIGMADISRTDEDRVWYINSALVLMNGLKQYFIILEKLEVLPTAKRKRRSGCCDTATNGTDGNVRVPKIEAADVVDKDLVNKVDALVKSIISQLVRWREKPRGEGVNQYLSPDVRTAGH